MCCALCTISTEAQSFTERIQQKKDGKGSITIHQDPEIKKLVDGKYSANNAAGMRPDVKPEKPAQQEQQPKRQKETVPQKDKTQNRGNGSDRDSASLTDTETDDTTLDTSKKVMRHSYKTTGYRVQVWAGGNSRVDRQKAEKAGLTIKRNIPDTPVYVHFYSPRWICRIGNYRTYEEAHRVLQEVKKLGYPEAVIVKGKITVQY